MAELVKLSEDGEITHSVSYINKASGKVVEKLYAKVESKRLEKAEAFLTDMTISRFSDLLGGLNAIESPDSPNDELQRDELLRRDIGKVVGLLTPYISRVGLTSGGVTVGKHVFSSATKLEGGPSAPKTEKSVKESRDK